MSEDCPCECPTPLPTGASPPVIRSVFLLWVCGILALFLSSGPVHAGGVVGGCTEASLRAALIGGGNVTFSGNCNLTISQQLVINQADTTIDASGYNVSIGGNNAVPLFDVWTNLTLRGLSLVNGNSPTSGGALYVRPGVVVVASQCIFAGNSATGTNGLAGANGVTNSVTTGGSGSSGTPGTSASGGAIYNLGAVSLVGCILTNNRATGGTGGNGGAGGPGGGTFAVGGNGGDGASGGLALGGAVHNLGDLTLSNCAFSANSAVGGNGSAGGVAGAGKYPGLVGNGGAGGSGSGGAVFNGMNLTLTGSTFSTNSASGGTSATGGMHGNGTGITGIRGADAAGGAIYNAWSAVVTNCTFFTNTVLGGAAGAGGNGGGTFGVPGDGGDGGNGIGGAIDNGKTLTLVNCTLASGGAFGGTNGLPGSGNFSGATGQMGVAQGGNIANPGASLTLLNSILAASVSGANAFGAFTDAGYNLSSDTVASLGALSSQNLDPRLGPLAANGGPTFTMSLLTNSPAIDRIPPGLSQPTDQRGFPRPINGLADIGAFEFGAAAIATNVVLSISNTMNGLVQLNGAGTAGLPYLVQASTNLSDWQTISTNTAPIQFSEPITNLSARFYRISR